MRMLVTGRHGQLAQSLAERGGDNVLLLGRPELDLAIPGAARNAIIAAEPDLIVNAAAFTAVDVAETEEQQATRINADAAGQVAAAACALGIPLIHISTDYVFDGTATEPYAEMAPTAPINAYGRSKLAGEIAVRAATDDYLILRTSWLVSPFGRNFIRTMVDLGQQREKLSVVADQHGNPTSALDLVAVAVQDELARLGMSSATIAPIATADWPTPARRPAYSALNTTKVTRDFGITLPDWRALIGPIVARLVV